MPIKQGIYYYIKPNGSTDTLEIYDEVLTTTEHIYAVPLGTRVVYTAMVSPDYGTASQYRAPQYNSSNALAVAYRLQIPLDEASWKDIKSIIESGVAKDFWEPGDVTAPFTIKGTIDGVSVNTTARAQIIGIDHNTTYEGINNVHFAIVAESTTKGGHPVVLTALGTHKHHTSVTNTGGWRLSDIRPVCEEVFAALPTDARAVISYTPKYTDNKGYIDANSYNNSISYTYNHIWTPAANEYVYNSSGNSSANTFEKNYQAQYAYMSTNVSSGGNRYVLGHAWSRTSQVTNKNYIDLSSGNPSISIPSAPRNVLFCFAIGGYNGDITIGSTAGAGPCGAAGVKPGGLVVKTGAVLNFKLLRSLPFYLKDIATIQNIAGTISAEDIVFLGDDSTYGQYDNRQAGSGNNLQLYFQGLKLTGSTTPNVIIVKAAANGYDESIIKVPFTVTKTDATLTLSQTAVSFTSQTTSQNTTVTLTSNQEDNVTPVIISTAGTVVQYKGGESLTDGTLEYRWTYKTSPSTQPSSLYIRNRKKGNVTVTVRYPETDRFLSISKTIAVTNTAYLGDLDALNPTDIQDIINNGQAANVFKIGDSIPITLSGTVGTCNMTGTYKIVIIGIDHNPTVEGTKKVHCMLRAEGSTDSNEDDIEIAFVDDGYGTNGASTSNTNYFQHNIGTSSSFDTNGYFSSQFRGKITNFVNLFPNSSNNNWRGLIKTHLKTYYISGTNGDTNPHAVRDKMFLLSYYELMGSTASNVNDSSGTQRQYAYFQNLNTRKRKYKHNDTSAIAGYHTRDVQQHTVTNSVTTTVDNATRYVIWSGSNLSVGIPVNNWYDSGFVPCFVWAAAEPAAATSVTKPSYTNNWSTAYNGSAQSPTIDGKQLNAYTGWETVTGDGIYKYRVDAGQYYIYCDAYEATEPSAHKIKLVLKDAINTTWANSASTNIIIDWEVSKMLVTVPTIQTSNGFVLNGNRYEKEYTGSTIKPTIVNAPNTSIATLYEYSNYTTLSATGVGNYNITYQLVNTQYYMWSNGSTDRQYRLYWGITRKKVNKPSTSSTTSYVYDGTEKYIAISNHNGNFPVSCSTVGANVTNGRLKATEPGTYSVTYSLGDNKKDYQWSDGTDNDVTFTLTISKRGITKPTLKSGDIIYSGSGYVIANSTYLNNHDSTYINYSGSGSAAPYNPTDAGDYTLTAKLSKPKFTYWNYNVNDTSDITIPWSIKRKGVSKPSLSQNSFTYSPNKTIDITQYLQNFDTNKMKVTDEYTTGNAVGNYALHVVPLKNYCWDKDNSNNTGEIELKWQITAQSGAPPYEILASKHKCNRNEITFCYSAPSGSVISINKITCKAFVNNEVFGTWSSTSSKVVYTGDMSGNVQANIIGGSDNERKIWLVMTGSVATGIGEYDHSRYFDVSLEVKISNSQYTKDSIMSLTGYYWFIDGNYKPEQSNFKPGWWSRTSSNGVWN